MAGLNWQNPYTGAVENNIMVALADHTEMKTLHMVTADPFRTPTFTPFADPDWFFFATGGATPATCATPAACAFIPARTSQSFAWNHGDIQDEIASTWVGYVGPGVDRPELMAQPGRITPMCGRRYWHWSGLRTTIPMMGV